MFKKHLLLFVCFFLFINLNAQQEAEESLSEEELTAIMDSINNSLDYQRGYVDISNGLATLSVPEGFKFLGPEDAEYVLTVLWGNPPASSLGLLFPEDMTPFSDDLTYAVEVNYTEDGYIKDDDAADLDYDDLLKDMQDEIKELNKIRAEEGYSTYELTGWASPPYYDAENKKLHWAKSLMFEGAEEPTLNYDIRVLGRKGFLTMSAIADLDQLSVFNKDRDKILSSIAFTEGNQYKDFDPKLDKVAAYGIGGLIAGKILAKAGFLALLLKFWKFLAIGAIALYAGLKKFVFGAKQEETAGTIEDADLDDTNEAN